MRRMDSKRLHKKDDLFHYDPVRMIFVLLPWNLASPLEITRSVCAGKDWKYSSSSTSVPSGKYTKTFSASTSSCKLQKNQPNIIHVESESMQVAGYETKAMNKEYGAFLLWEKVLL